MRKSIFTIAGTVLLAATVIGPAAAPASASTTGDTTTTFTINSGSLSISVPISANLGTVPSGTSRVSALIGDVQVLDLRAATSGSWTATASSTTFITGAGTPSQTIPTTDVVYDPGEAVATTGNGTFTPGAPGNLSAPRVAFTATATVGNTAVTWDPQVTILLPPGAVAGDYTGTITHSVA